MNEIKDLSVVIWIVGTAVGLGITVVGGLLIWAIKSLITSIIGLRLEVVHLKAVLPNFEKRQDKSEKDINKAFQRIEKLETKGVQL